MDTLHCLQLCSFLSTLSGVLQTPSFPIVAPFLLIPLCTAPPPPDLASLVLPLYLFLFTPRRLSSPFRPPFSHCVCRSAVRLLFTKASRVPISSSSLHSPPANLPRVPFFFFTTSSFLSLSPLIYLSRWAATRSDALPLCLCCVCVICIPCLPQ